MVVHRYLLGLLFVCRAALADAGHSQESFDRDLAIAHEDAYVMPTGALRQLEGLRAGRSGRDLGRVLVETSLAHFRRGDTNKAIAVALQAEKLGRDLHDDALLGKAMLAHADPLSRFVHDQDTARQLIRQAAQLAGHTSDACLQTTALVAEGRLADEDGRTGDGIQLVGRALALARSSADPDALSLALREQARLLASVGSEQEALALADELLAVARASGIPAQLAHARLSEYAIAARAGHPKRAALALQAAVDILEKLNAKDRLAVPLANLAELYIQARRYGDAERTSDTALRLAREFGDENGSQLASFQSGIAAIYFRNIANGRARVDSALDSLQNDDQYVRLLLEYGHALGQVGEDAAALTVYEKAGSVSLAAWRKEKQLSYQALQRAYDYQKKQTELAALHHDSLLKAAELQNERRLRTLWLLLSGTASIAAFLIALLYRKVAAANKSLRVKNEQLFMQSTRDALTGLFNRHYFHEQVVPRHHGKAGPAGPERRTSPDENTGGVFLILDIDHFKSINDGFGHSAGDAVLKTVASRLSSSLREQDVLIRWGGEEFLAYLPGVATDEARVVCARLLAAVSSTPIAVEERQLTVTVSIGFCPKPVTAAEADPDWETLVHLADLCLYLAKTGGRNQAFGISDAVVLTPGTIAAADADLRQASLDGLITLMNVTTPQAPLARAEA